MGFVWFDSTQEMLSKQAVQTKQMLSKQAVKIAKQAEEHERFINKVGFFVFPFQNVFFFNYYYYLGGCLAIQWIYYGNFDPLDSQNTEHAFSYMFR